MTGVQTCALPIYVGQLAALHDRSRRRLLLDEVSRDHRIGPRRERHRLDRRQRRTKFGVRRGSDARLLRRRGQHHPGEIGQSGLGECGHFLQRDRREDLLNEAVFVVGEACLDHYQAIKTERKTLDFVDLEWLAWKLVTDPAHAAYLHARLDARYRHLLIDEFQDTNPLQWRIVRAWLDAYGEDSARPTVFLVGDPKQSIYRFRRADPRVLWSDVRSIVMLGMNYGPDVDPRDVLAQKDKGAISVYARHRDYHDLVKGRLKMLASWIAGEAKKEPALEMKVFVDTAPVMEKPLAAAAGLGWQGKHTNLVSREFGSWLFLGSIFLNIDLPADEPEIDHCGSCSACLEACPTEAFIGPYKLDARRCISYLTIELKGSIPLEFRPLIGNRVYGCDDCQLICPWNAFAQSNPASDFAVRHGLDAARLVDLFAWTEAEIGRAHV